MGLLLYFRVGIVQEFCRGWQNFKALVEMYHGYVKFCHIGRILKILGYNCSANNFHREQAAGRKKAYR
jgi:hypothetical protein